MTDCFKRTLRELFGNYRKSAKCFPWDKIKNIRDWEHNDPARLAMLDAVSGLVDLRLGNDKSAREYWSDVILSKQASNACKIIAHAGMATLYVKEKNTEGFKLALNGLLAIGDGYDIDPWTIEALNVLMEILEDRCIFTDEAKKLVDIIINHDGLKDVQDKTIEREIALLRANSRFLIASALVTDEELHQAEKMLTREIIPVFERTGSSLRLADANNLLCLIDWLDGALGYATTEEEVAWTIYVKNDPLSEKTLYASSALLDLYYEQGFDDPEARLLDLLVRNDIDDPQGFLDMLNAWIGQDQEALRDTASESLGESQEDADGNGL